MLDASLVKDAQTPQVQPFCDTELSPGLTVDMEIESQFKDQHRGRATLVGWRPERFLLLRPQDALFHRLYPGSFVILRYLVAGQIHACKSRILTTATSPDKLVFCQYP
ncbi:flagellar brake domain-containing protein [Ferrimonas balearica]|uniref:flagellar brake domain-containing protein n=1 Tax=Ferrimonas balearica TaxID=44012 RepID=UPI001C99D34D|nr:flagellar brake domain-containing protein [Ferrimonas balearica]MBY5990815.1 flagellar brake protein [Ferrimonas balearica]